ncbi:hypothetical protein KKC17_02085 [Patescibacteria group bacterium]|nr:hypothetical protein [Patescibacteria group bacterium]
MLQSSYYSQSEFIFLAGIVLLVISVLFYFLFKFIFKKKISSNVLLSVLATLSAGVILSVIYSLNHRSIDASSNSKVLLYHDSTVVSLVDYPVISGLSSLRFTYGPKVTEYVINVPKDFGKYLSYSSAVVEVIYDYNNENLLIKECQRMLINNPGKVGDYNLDTLFTRVISSVRDWQTYEQPKIYSVEYYYKNYLNNYLANIGIKVKGVNVLYFDPPLARGPHQN